MRLESGAPFLAHLTPMRIIAGERRGFRLVAPRGLAVRPTLDRVRESLFSILGPCVAGLDVADLYAGCGCLGLEALSRGARSCIFIEHARPALDALRRNVEHLRYGERALVRGADALRWAGSQSPTDSQSFGLVLADPPYDTGLALRTLQKLGEGRRLEPGAIVVMQCSTREPLPPEAGVLTLFRAQRYGDTVVYFYETAQPPDAAPGNT